MNDLQKKAVQMLVEKWFLNGAKHGIEVAQKILRGEEMKPTQFPREALDGIEKDIQLL